MKIIKNLNLHKKSYKLIYLLLIITLLSFTKIKTFGCTPEIGCLGRHKYMSYVTVLSKTGEQKHAQSIMNYKVIYIFTDKLVFYGSSDTGNPSLESEVEIKNIEQQESKIERVINFGDIILDCGKYKNKLCHAMEYSGIDQISTFKTIKETIKIVPESLCILIPFFENAYKKMHDKIAYICGTQLKDLYDIINLKNSLSRNIEFYQLNNSLDRFNGFNGLLHKELNMIINPEGKTTRTYAKIYNRGIAFINMDTKLFQLFYSYNDLRKIGFGAYKVKDGLLKNKVPKEWGKGLISPIADCCIYLNGEFNKLTACLADDKGDSITAEDICSIKIEKIYSEIRSSLRGVIFSEAFHQINSNELKAKNCESKEFNVFKYRLLKTAEYSIENDCKKIMNYINMEDNENKKQWCKKNYEDELSLEKKLMSLSKEKVYNSIDNCVFNANPGLFDHKKFDGK
jgi:hypothetical protein